MDIDFETLIEEEINLQCELIADYGMSKILIEKFGKSFFMVDVYQALQKDSFKLDDPSIYKVKHDLNEALTQNNLIYQANPNVPKNTIWAICVALTILTTKKFFSNKNRSGSMRLLMIVALLRGAAMSNSPNHVALITSEINSFRKEMLSEAGERGRTTQQRPYALLKAWALEMADGMRGQDVDIARKISALIPKHLANISKNPDRFIYEALRGRRKNN
jgi:hypothetical protein